MACPFPGLDPFLEGQVWFDFRPAFLPELRRTLIRRLRPRYTVYAEGHLYLEPAPEWNGSGRIRPDLTVVEPMAAAGGIARGATPVVSSPLSLLLPLPHAEEVRQLYLEIREPSDGAVVTLIALLSPANKARTSEGRRAYLAKRARILRSEVHLVELDFLRGGERLPMAEPFPDADYAVVISRAEERPRAQVWPWDLPDPLPTVPIPLRDGESCRLDLQAVFTDTYDASSYDYTFRRDLPVHPELDPEQAAWVRAQLDRGRKD